MRGRRPVEPAGPVRVDRRAELAGLLLDVSESLAAAKEEGVWAAVASLARRKQSLLEEIDGLDRAPAVSASDELAERRRARLGDGHPSGRGRRGGA